MSSQYKKANNSEGGQVNTEPSNETKKIELSELEQIQLLHREGLSVAAIAKKLGKGKTEIQLLLKFQQNSQEKP